MMSIRKHITIITELYLFYGTSFVYKLEAWGKTYKMTITNKLYVSDLIGLMDSKNSVENSVF